MSTVAPNDVGEAIAEVTGDLPGADGDVVDDIVESDAPDVRELTAGSDDAEPGSYSRAGIRVFGGLVILAGISLLAWGTPQIDNVPVVPMLVWVGLMAFLEIRPARLPHGGSATVSSVLDLGGILVFGPWLTAWIDLFGTLTAAVAESTPRPWKKLVFNLSLFVLQCASAGWVYTALGGEVGVLESFDLLRMLPAIVAMSATYFLVNALGVGIALALARREPLLRVAGALARYLVVFLAASAPLGVVLAYLYLHLGYVGVGVLVLPLLLARYTLLRYAEMREDMFNFVGTLADVIEEVDPYTRQHSHRVSTYARAIAREMGLPERRVQTIATAGILHDIGKVSIDTADILASEKKLTREQRHRMARHPVIGAEIVAKVRMLEEASAFVRSHHERIDGTGYPDGLRGDSIPLGARIIHVADTVDAMTSDRSYRRALPLQAALDELKKFAGKQFDPEVVAAVERLHARHEFPVLRDEAIALPRLMEVS
jgi:putative nucleotidyltransferase with HDIG domain